MTETPSNQQGLGAPADDQDLPERDPERRSKPAPANPIDRPGPPDPGEQDADFQTGVESFERPGRDGNWERPAR